MVPGEGEGGHRAEVTAQAVLEGVQRGAVVASGAVQRFAQGAVEARGVATWLPSSSNSPVESAATGCGNRPDGAEPGRIDPGFSPLFGETGPSTAPKAAGLPPQGPDLIRPGAGGVPQISRDAEVDQTVVFRLFGDFRATDGISGDGLTGPVEDAQFQRFVGGKGDAEVPSSAAARCAEGGMLVLAPEETRHRLDRVQVAFQILGVQDVRGVLGAQRCSLGSWARASSLYQGAGNSRGFE